MAAGKPPRSSSNNGAALRAGAEGERGAAPAPTSMRRTVMAVAAAWLFPGVGHLLLGRTTRAVVFSLLVLGSFGLGLAHDGRLALRDDSQPVLSSLQMIANLGMGPLDFVARVAIYNRPAYVLDRSSADFERRREIFRARTSSLYSNYGTAYLWTAGLMNLLLLFDVWDISRGKKS